MLELARDLLPLLRSGAAVAAVTVTAVARSAPRGVGATMAVTADGRVIGSISGGCVEGDAVMLAHQARLSGRAHTARLGFSDDAAHAAGLACGGSVDVVAYPVPAEPLVHNALARAADGRSASVGVVLSGADAGLVVGERMLRAAADGGRTAAGPLAATLEARASRLVAAALDGDDVLVISAAARPRLLLLGAGEHAAALCRVGTAAGFAVEVCDVWPSLVTRERFPEAAVLAAGLPHEHLAALDRADLDRRTAVCVLTHDERVDVPALEVALSLPVGFVGAMGARATVARRARLLRERGVSEHDLARVRSPLGLDLGGSSPDETALSVLAEIVAARHGGSGLPLHGTTGPLHRRDASATAAPAPRTGDAADGSCAASVRPLPLAPAGAP